MASTSHQHSFIKKLLAQAEFDHRTVTFMHRRLGAPEEAIGKPVDDWLRGLNLAQASVLIDKLKEEIGEEDEDED